MEKDLAKVFAVQTAVLASVVEMLIETGALQRDQAVTRLYTLLMKFGAEGGSMPQAGPITHLIALLEGEQGPKT